MIINSMEKNKMGRRDREFWQWGVGMDAILNKIIKECHTKLTFELNHEGTKGTRDAYTWKRSISSINVKAVRT